MVPLRPDARTRAMANPVPPRVAPAHVRLSGWTGLPESQLARVFNDLGGIVELRMPQHPLEEAMSRKDAWRHVSTLLVMAAAIVLVQGGGTDRGFFSSRLREQCELRGAADP